MSDFLDLAALAESLLANASPARRAATARAMAVAIRKTQAARIKANLNPDGTPFVPRKRRELRGKKGRLRTKGQQLGPMFRKLGTVSMLTATGTADGAEVGFKGAGTNRIAPVHQYGLRDRVGRSANAPEIRYPVRILLGLTDAEIQAAEAALFEAIAR